MSELRLYQTKIDDSTYENPVSDRVDNENRPGRALFDLFTWSGEPGEVRFQKLTLVNESPNYKYRSVAIRTEDLDSQGQLDLTINQSFTADDAEGNDITIPSSMVGMPRLLYHRDDSLTEIPRDPTLYETNLDLPDLLPYGSGDHDVKIFVLGVIDPGTPTATYNDVRPIIEGIRPE